MRMTKTFLEIIKRLSLKCTNPTDAEDAMKHVMITTLTKIKAIYVKDLLVSLRDKNLGTPSVFYSTKKLCQKINSSKHKAIMRTIMDEKYKDAMRCLRRNMYEERKLWKQVKKDLRRNGIVVEFNQAWSHEKTHHFKKLRKKKTDKIKWIANKFQATRDIPDMYKGITVADQHITEEFATKPECYGNATISTSEEEALKLHPKYSIFEKVGERDNEAEIEKALAKMRWTKMNKEKTNTSNQENTTAKRTFDIEEREFNFQNTRSTDLPFNTRTYIPKRLRDAEEIPLQNLKIELIRLSKQYISGQNKRRKVTNLTKEQDNGLKSLQKRRDNNEIVVFQTDKSSKFSVDTLDNYIEAAAPHIRDDQHIDAKQYELIEKKVNAHSVFWVNMLQAAKVTKDYERFKTSMLSHNSEYATQYLFRKDHKEYTDKVKGPPTRPLCDVSDSYGHRLSFLISTILKEVTSEGSTVCTSTEDMIASIQSANEGSAISEKAVIGSLDVNALYPSLDIDFTIEVAINEFQKSGVKIKSIDYEEMGLYLSLNCNSEYLRDKGISRCCPTKRAARGRAPTITGSGSDVTKWKRFAPWKAAANQPDDNQKMIMQKEALKIVLLLLMKNHVYIFNNELRLQSRGGAIGVDLTGVLAQIFMTWWDREFLSRLVALNLPVILYERYVDDINICTEGTEPGISFQNNELVKDSNMEETEREMQIDSRTFEIIKKIGDSIHSSIKLKADVPSNHGDKKVPILDLKVWIEKVTTDDGERHVILHEHYIKDVANRFVIHREAALSLATKRTVLTQECLRIMLNCSPMLNIGVVNKHITYFMKRMQASGYDKLFRYEVLSSAMVAYEKIRDADTNGERPMYRKKDWMRSTRRVEKENKRKRWYCKGGYESVLFVPATPQSEFKNLMQSTINKTQVKIKVVERSGTKMVRKLQRNDPFKRKHCEKQECFVCSTSGKGSCRVTGITYAISCQKEDCPFLYTGQTGTNACTRGYKHLEDYDKKRHGSSLWKHCTEEHNGEGQQFNMEVLDTCRSDSTKRQILEALRIRDTDPAIRMNDRSEWNMTSIPRINVS